MAYKIKLLPAAYNDLINAGKWYNTQREFLGDEFKTEINSEIERLSNNPEHYQIYFKELRQTVVKRFPYSIFFITDENLKQVIIFGVLHNSRNPRVISGRVK
ncbi:type II toxin-antitoxin system RelE/ParE family toxin [Flavobacterium sp. RHBU_3]|uniref:type II toxin-antitoxin system RelE/ParE family toxin n=1 Tax=Flavobacterium sp. RHBU_3 TaxID=3391184 RepID=UPI0039847395